MNCMTNNIVAIQGNHPSKLNPITDTSIFLANEIQSKNYRIFYYDPKNLSIINSKVIAEGFFITFTYKQKKFFKILKKQKLDLTKCKFVLIRQDPPFNLEYISTTYILDSIKTKVRVVNDPSSIRSISEKLYSAKYQKFMPSTIFTQNIDEIKDIVGEDFFDEESGLSDIDKITLQNRIVEDAFYNSYLVITKKTTFNILMEEWNDGSGVTALLAHDPDSGPRNDQLINMIVYYSEDEREEYEKCAELLEKLHELYPETVGQDLI